MAGIVSFGAYIPYNRLDRKLIRQEYGGAVPKGEKAVANFDEDSLTMAVAAALDCAQGFDSSTLDRVYYATTSPPYEEKGSSAVIAGTLDMGKDVKTMDVVGSLPYSLHHDCRQMLLKGTRSNGGHSDKKRSGQRPV